MRWLKAIALGIVSGTVTFDACTMARPARAKLGDAPKELAAKTVEITSKSGSILRAWLFEGRAGAGAVLLLHGVGANRAAMLSRARFLHQAGYTVLAPDFQAHGESPGDHITFGAKESEDADAAIRFLRAESPTDAIGVIGVSMGGAATLLGDGARCADAIVLESVYPTIHDAVVDRLHTWLGPIGFMAPVVAPLVIRSVGSEIGVTEDQLRPIDHIATVSAPLFVISGTEDPYTPITEARALFERASAPKEFWPVKGAGHEDFHAFAPKAYEKLVGEFLAQHLRGPASHRVSAPCADQVQASR